MPHADGFRSLYGEYIDMAGCYFQHPITVIEQNGVARVERYALARSGDCGLQANELIAGETFTHSLDTSFA
jgi:hypothetical protein